VGIETVVCVVVARQLGATVKMRGGLEEQVGLTAEQVALGSAEIASFVEDFARSAATQANMVNQIATTSCDMRQQVSANQVAAAATRRRVIQTVEDIGQAHQRLNHVNTEMQAVATVNRRLSGIVNLMMDIARQTNILAVNASIEASRGGASGGGFSVIAEQVRDLAARTTQASGEIDELLSNSVAKVESSARDIESIAGGFAGLNATAQERQSLLEQVNETGRTQASGIESISDSIHKISAETQKFAADVETAGTSSQLGNLADGLRHSLAALAWARITELR